MFSREQFDAEVERRMEVDPPAADAPMLPFITMSSLRTFFEVSLQAMRVTTGAGAIELLLESERVLRDLLESLAAQTAGLYTQQVVVREWSSQLRQEYEFRGFVHGGALTAVSQYNHYCYFPDQVARRDALLRRIVDFFEAEVRPRLADAGEDYARCVVDVALLADGGAAVVEVNPFNRLTGAGLYRWEDPDDLAQLEGRAGPVELRLLEAAPPRLENVLEMVLAQLPAAADADADADAGVGLGLDWADLLRPPMGLAAPVAAAPTA